MGHTMKEVARLAGVAPATVSRVLNDTGPGGHLTLRGKRRQIRASSCVAMEQTGGDEAGHNGGKASFHIHHDDCNPQAEQENFTDPDSGGEFPFHAGQHGNV